MMEYEGQIVIPGFSFLEVVVESDHPCNEDVVDGIQSTSSVGSWSVQAWNAAVAVEIACISQYLTGLDVDL